MLTTLAVVYVALTGIRIYAGGTTSSFHDYVRWTFTPAPATAGLRHIFVLVTDHFEPDADPVRTPKWANQYRALASRHRDGYGRPPQHTWFYPGEPYEPNVLKILGELTASGVGEVELHLHHENDTSSTLEAKLRTAIARFQAFGFFCEPQR